jgi:hypothetical protein
VGERDQPGLEKNFDPVIVEICSSTVTVLGHQWLLLLVSTYMKV